MKLSMNTAANIRGIASEVHIDGLIGRKKDVEIEFLKSGCGPRHEALGPSRSGTPSPFVPRKM